MNNEALWGGLGPPKMTVGSRTNTVINVEYDEYDYQPLINHDFILAINKFYYFYYNYSMI